METLNGLFRRSELNGLLTSLLAPAIQYRVSLYADDHAICLTPMATNIKLSQAILEFFAGVSFLHTNLSKCQFTPIRCSEEQIVQSHAVVSMSADPFSMSLSGRPIVNIQA
jgi:hypothetical protein